MVQALEWTPIDPATGVWAFPPVSITKNRAKKTLEALEDRINTIGLQILPTSIERPFSYRQLLTRLDEIRLHREGLSLIKTKVVARVQKAMDTSLFRMITAYPLWLLWVTVDYFVMWLATRKITYLSAKLDELERKIQTLNPLTATKQERCLSLFTQSQKFVQVQEPDAVKNQLQQLNKKVLFFQDEKEKSPTSFSIAFLEKDQTVNLAQCTIVGEGEGKTKQANNFMAHVQFTKEPLIYTIPLATLFEQNDENLLKSIHTSFHFYTQGEL